MSSAPVADTFGADRVASPSFERRAWWVAWILLAGAALMAWANLKHSGLWIDEIYTLHAISLPWQEMFFERLRMGHFPVYFVFLKGWLRAWGTLADEVTLRLPSLGFWCLACLGYGMFLRRLAPRPVAPFAFVLFALNGLAIRQAMEARMYTLALLEAVWITWAYFETALGGRRWARLTLALLPVVAAWTTVSSLLLLVGLSADSFRRRGSNRRSLLFSLGTSWFLLLLTLLPAALTRSATGAKNEIAHVPPAALPVHLVTLIAGIPGWEDYYKVPPSRWWFVALGAIFALFVLGNVVWRWKSLSEQARTCFVVVVIPWLSMVATWVLAESTGWSVAIHGPGRYLIAMLPCSALMTAHSLESYLSTLSRRALVFGALCVFLAWDAFLVMRLPLETPRELLTNYLAPRWRRGDAVIVVPDLAREAVQLYIPDIPITDAFPRSLSAVEIEARLRRLDPNQRVWLVWLHGKNSQAVRVADQTFGKGVSSSSARYLGERRVILYRATEGPLIQ